MKIREIIFFSQILTINCMRFGSVSQFCLETNQGFTPNQTKNPGLSTRGFFILSIRMHRLNAFKRFKRFRAVEAAVKGFAGGRAKRRDALGVGAAALGAGQGLVNS